jgi:drug/metabolite transporter (DMT)-like permease
MAALSSSVAPKTSWRAIVALFFVTVIWGGTFVWMKQGIAAVDAHLGPGHATTGVALFTLVRFGLAALCVPAFIPAGRRVRSRAVWTGGFWLGLLLFAGFVLQMLGLGEVTPAVSAFLTSLYVLFTAILTAGIERRGPSLALFLGALLATCGAGFIRGRPEISLHAGELATVACAFVFALHILATDRITKRLPPMAVTTTTFTWVGIGSLVLLALSLRGKGSPGARAILDLLVSPEFAVPSLLSAILATVVALSLMNQFQRELDPVRAAILYAFEPIWASVFGLLYGTDAVTVYLWLGGGLLLAGNLVAEIGQRRRLQAAALE